jgi:hypothetical protein
MNEKVLIFRCSHDIGARLVLWHPCFCWRPCSVVVGVPSFAGVFAWLSLNLLMVKEPRNRFQGIYSARLGNDSWALSGLQTRALSTNF